MRWSTTVAAIVCALAVSALPGGAQPRFAGQTLVVTSYGGSWEQFMRSQIVPGFEAETGAKVELAVGLSRDWIAKLRAAGKTNPPYDVIIANTTWVSAVRKEGFFAKLTPDKVPNLADVWPDLRVKDDVGVLSLVGPLGLAYRTDLVANPPRRWKDLWNPEYKGKLALYSIANSAAPMFLMLVSRIWTGEDKNMDVAFQKMQELKPFRQSDFSQDLMALLTRGEAQIGIVDSSETKRQKRAGVPVEWVYPLEGVFMFEQDTNVTLNTRNKDLAFAWVNYFISQPVQEKWAAQFLWTPANRKVRITGELSQVIPVHTQAQIRQIMRWDWDWVNAGAREMMIQRWNREILGR